MFLRKYKLQSLFISNPSFFLILELLPVTNKSFTAMKKMLISKGFDVKYLRTKEALGILTTLSHSKKENNKELFKSNLICIRPLSKTSTLQHFPFEELASFKITILVGASVEGLFYNPKTILSLTTKNLETSIVTAITTPVITTPSLLMLPLMRILQCLRF
jgi:hypothetical protein